MNYRLSFLNTLSETKICNLHPMARLGVPQGPKSHYYTSLAIYSYGYDADTLGASSQVGPGRRENVSAPFSYPHPRYLFIYFCIFQASEGSRETSVCGRGARVTRDGRKIDLALARLKNAEK